MNSGANRTRADLRWEKHGAVFILYDIPGYTRAFLSVDWTNGLRVPEYICVTTSAGNTPVKEYRGRNRKTLQRVVEGELTAKTSGTSGPTDPRESLTAPRTEAVLERSDEESTT